MNVQEGPDLFALNEPRGRLSQVGLTSLGEAFRREQSLRVIFLLAWRKTAKCYAVNCLGSFGDEGFSPITASK